MIQFGMKNYFKLFMKNIKNYIAINKLVRQFEELKTMEDDSARLYATLLPDISDVADRGSIESVIADEQKHSKMAQSIVDILRS